MLKVFSKSIDSIIFDKGASNAGKVLAMFDRHFCEFSKFLNTIDQPEFSVAWPSFEYKYIEGMKGSAGIVLDGLILFVWDTYFCENMKSPHVGVAIFKGEMISFDTSTEVWTVELTGDKHKNDLLIKRLIEEAEARKNEPPSGGFVFRSSCRVWFLIPQGLDEEFSSYDRHLGQACQAEACGEDFPDWTGTDFSVFTCGHPDKYIIQSPKLR